ncbi:MAG: ABC transporter permease [Candidatus Bipolaricaulota bacterium]|nr:ABC transporter permease [Candidatus Bipolaricaulota bacterium]MBS3792500.1 ABC transporter permease [Candidatus Bipolaricaulota bacterium]
MSLLIDALEQGMVYGIMALGVLITFRVLDFPDLTVDGSFTMGAGITAALIVGGWNPVVALLLGVAGGMVAGIFTGLLSTKLNILNLLAGILTMTLLYSVNLRIMGRPNIPLLGQSTVLDQFRSLLTPIGLGDYSDLVFFGLVLIFLKFLLDLFFNTELGLALRATGDNEQMILSQGVNTDTMKILGLAISNGLVAFSGGLVAQYTGFADVGMGIGMIIAGLASVIVGETLLPTKSFIWVSTGVIAGSIIYRTAIMLALRYGYNFGFKASDLKLITALIVIVALATPQVREKLNLKLGESVGI